MGSAWALTVGLSGGDFFDGWRQLLPGVAAFHYAASAGLGAQAARVPGWLAAILLPAHIYLANFSFRAFVRTDDVRSERQVRPIALALRSGWGALDPLLAVDAAGALPYYTRFRSLDMLGLNDRWISHHPPDLRQSTAIGHDYHDVDYVWRSEPDVVVWNGAGGASKPRFPTGALASVPGFDRRYTPIRVGGVYKRELIVGWLLVRRDGGSLGHQRSPGRVDAPAWHFASPKANPAMWRNGQLAPFVSVAKPGLAPGISLAAGQWQVTAAPSGIEVRVRCGSQASAWSDVVYVHLQRLWEIDVEVRSASSVQVRSSAIDRVDDRHPQASDTHCRP